MSDFITLVEALAIHTDQINQYGGSYGIRDKGSLEAALWSRKGCLIKFSNIISIMFFQTPCVRCQPKPAVNLPPDFYASW